MNSIDGTEQSWFENNPKKASLILLMTLSLLIEFVVRLFLPPHLIERKHVVPDELYFKNYRNKIEFVTYPNKPDNFEPVKTTINSIGVRGPELAKKSKYRVLNIGDSFIQADEVSFEDTFGEKLNRSNLDIHFVSHGIASWSPTPEFSWIYHNVNKINYDEVNLFLCVNDFFKTSSYGNVDEFYRSYANYSEDGTPISYDIASFQQRTLRDFVREHVYIYKLLSLAKSKVTSVLRTRKDPEEKFNVANQIVMLSGDSKTWDPELAINVLDTLEVVKHIDEFLKHNNIRLNVLFVPLGLAWEDEFGSGKQALSDDWERTAIISQNGIELFTKEYLGSHNIDYIELSNEFELFKKENSDLSLFFDMDGHWNENGHDLVYNILHDHYRSRKANL